MKHSRLNHWANLLAAAGLSMDMPTDSVPSIRHRNANRHPVRIDGDYVVYWMIANRRLRFNYALQHAVDRARSLGKPLVVLEPLSASYPWASVRLHRFIIEGMRENRQALASGPVTYYPYVEPDRHCGDGLLLQWARRACTIVTDEFPCFFLPKMVDAISQRLDVPLEVIDSNGIIPLRLPERTFTVAHSFRRWMQKHILDALIDFPLANPLKGRKLPKLAEVPQAISNRWPQADLDQLLETDGLESIPIDHSVPPCTSFPGGSQQARRRLKEFLKEQLSDYDQLRNHPDAHATSDLSPYLHFGHIASHEIVGELIDHQHWTPDRTGKPNGKVHGFFNMSVSAEAFLDQVLTWREIGFNFCFHHADDYDQFESLPEWAKKTLGEHARDQRTYLYDMEQFELAKTHDPLWNAGQRELVVTGKMHNYIRMLWGKNILAWTPSPQEALRIMIHLNNKYGLDGRDPNSYSGIFWVLGRFDRAWGPKRPVFGSVRYMTSDSTRRKLKLKNYLQRWGKPGTENSVTGGGNA